MTVTALTESSSDSRFGSGLDRKHLEKLEKDLPLFRSLTDHLESDGVSSTSGSGTAVSEYLPALVSPDGQTLLLCVDVDVKSKLGDFIFPSKQLYDSGFDVIPQVMGLPKTAQFKHGCINCEFRTYGLCPFGFDKDSKNFHVLQKQTHVPREKNVLMNEITKHAYICSFRINYLLSFVDTHHGGALTYTKWLESFNRGMAQAVLMDDFQKLKSIELKLSELNDKIEIGDMDSKDPAYYNVQARRDTYRMEWQTLWDKLMKHLDRKLDRESTKKFEIDTVRKIQISDINRIIRESQSGSQPIVEAEFTSSDKSDDKEDDDDNEGGDDSDD